MWVSTMTGVTRELNRSLLHVDRCSLAHAVSRNAAASATLRMLMIRVNIDFDHNIRYGAQPGARNEFPYRRQRSAISRRSHRHARRIASCSSKSVAER